MAALKALDALEHQAPVQARSGIVAVWWYQDSGGCACGCDVVVAPQDPAVVSFSEGDESLDTSTTHWFDRPASDLYQQQHDAPFSLRRASTMSAARVRGQRPGTA